MFIAELSFGFVVDWTVSLKDGRSYIYRYLGGASATEAIRLAETLQRLDGKTRGGLNGGELFNFSVRAQCIAKIDNF
jgi:hypothetical protein